MSGLSLVTLIVGVFTVGGIFGYALACYDESRRVENGQTRSET